MSDGLQAGQAVIDMPAWLARPEYKGGPPSVRLARLCGNRTVVDRRPTRCIGTLLPDQATLHLDADGSATIDTTCDRCGFQGAAYFTWNAPD